jgi:hypothetical protein
MRGPANGMSMAVQQRATDPLLMMHHLPEDLKPRALVEGGVWDFVGLRRDDHPNPAELEVPVQHFTPVALVSSYLLGSQAWSTSSRSLDRTALHQER